MRLGHTSILALKKLLHFSLDEIKNSVTQCKICPCAKLTRCPFISSNIKSNSCFELLYVDLWGPYNVLIYNGNKYFLTIVDDLSRVTWIYLLK